MRRLTWVLGGVLLLGVWAPAARADSGYEDKELPLRLASAFVRFTEVSAFGGESVANRWSPAVNPASADWTCVERPAGVVLAGYWSHISFDEGNVIDLFGETALWDTRKYGTVHGTLSQIRSNQEEDKQGLVFDYETDTFQVQWAKRVRNWSAGLSFNYADTTFSQSFMGVPAYRADATTYRFRAGGLWAPACKWLIGAVAEYAWSPYDYSGVIPTPFGPMPFQGDDTQDQMIGRIGASYEYCKYSVVYADYQYAFFDNERDDLTVHRFSAGVQHNLFRFLFLRAGASIDQEGNLGLLAGIGAAFAKWGTIDFGYQYDMLPELEPNFGTSHTFQVVVALMF